MTVPSFSRSLLFWLGWPVLLFLLWAWVDSNRQHRWIILAESPPPSAAQGRLSAVSSIQGKIFWYSLRMDREHEVKADLRDGTITVISLPPGERFFFPVLRKWKRSSWPLEENQRCWFPRPRWERRSLDPDNAYTYLSIPYWLLTFLYLLLWSVTLCWWQRRKRRLAKIHSTGS